jgi:hypothetical protein
MPRETIEPRKPIILIGAPSGAGKTELSKLIIAHELPFFEELCSRPSVPIVRHDVKVLPEDLPRDQIHIIECATHRIDQMQKRYWPQLSRFLQDCELVIHVNMDVANKIVVRQYFQRIFTGPRRLNLFQRLLRVSKYKRLLGYVMTGQLTSAAAHWEAMGRTLAQTSTSRVAVVRARRSGDAYQFFLENRDSQTNQAA